ncbi:hypothetical protein F5888DRAFT_1729736 [Russula emetica]|nr:hypothetical protein F5888DRAFT_1729736 [Russula emetica]
MRHRIPHLWLFLAFAWSILVGLTSAAPAPAPSTLSSSTSSTETLYRRQENGSSFTGPVVTQTVQTINTPSGPATETCIVTLTPVTGNNGEPLVQVVRQCTIVPGAQSSGTQTEPPPSTSTTASTSLSSDAPPASTSSVDPGVSVVGFSSVPNPNPAATSTPSSTTPPSTSKGSTKPSSSSGMSAAADNTSATASSSAAAAFQIPGKKISVLPIGLGIFAGISVIALIVVGLVTYERTKYRKIFRQRKLAEQGSAIGYS